MSGPGPPPAAANNLWSQASDWPAFLAAGQAADRLGLRWSVEARGTTDDVFTHPRDVAVDGDGNVYTTHTSVALYGPEGSLLSEWTPPGEPSEVGIGPMFVATAPDGTVFVSVQMLDTIHRLRVVERKGSPLVPAPGDSAAEASPPIVASADTD